MIFSSVFAALFYTFLIGLVWPTADRSSVTEWALNAVSRSLWVSWLIVAISFWLNLPNLLWLLVPAVAVALWVNRREQLSARLPWSALSLLAALSCAYFAWAIAQGASTGEYRLIFHGWDALVSWNGWARELASNGFTPQPAAYPILFPGLWSLIYKAQGQSELWVITKAAMFVLLPILTLMVARLVEERFFIAAGVAGYFAFDFYFIRQHQPMLSGNMDIPVAIMMLVSGVMLAISTARSEEGKRDRVVPAFITASVLVGLASITKQAGMFMLLPWLLVAGTLAYRGQVRGRQLAVAGTAALLPLTLFMSMFFFEQTNPVGNIDHLRGLSAGGSGSSLGATYSLLVTALPQPFLYLMLFMAAMNVFAIMSLPGRLGLLLLAMAAVGVVIFSNCCAYDIRNGWWIFSLLAVSAVLGFLPFDRWLSRQLGAGRQYVLPQSAPAIVGIAGAIVVSLVAGFSFSPNRLQAAQDEWQAGVVQPELAALIAEHAPDLGEAGRVISAVQPLGFLPSIRGRYAFCYYLEEGCVRKTISRYPGSMVLVSPSEGTYYDDFSDKLTSEYLLGTALIFELYGPYND